MNRRHTLGLLGATALAGCAPGIPVAQLSEDPFEGGIGGTGIVGVMTGTGSVLLNGLRVELPSSTRVFANGRRVGESALVPGMALSIVARTRADRFEAQRIDMDAPLIGTLQRHGSGYAINGTGLSLDGVAAARLVGHRVLASGVWQADGRLRTSLLSPASDGAATVSGVLVGSAADGWQIGGTRLRTTAANRLTAGQFAVANGRFASGALEADTVQMGRFREGGGTLRQLSVEGYLEPISTAPGFRVSGLGHSFDQRLSLAPFATQRAVYFGPYDGRFRARRAVLLPEAQTQRRGLLQPDEGEKFSTGLTGPAARAVAFK